MHTSTVTVAVFEPTVKRESITYNAKDFKLEWYSGTGCGGQNRNKVQSSCRLTHIATGITKSAQTRSRENSFKLAKEAILQELTEHAYQANKTSRNNDRARQVGSGMRGDKIRTYREQDDTVSDHRTSNKASLKLIEQGRLTLLW